jgi:EpsI family protein
MRTAVTVLLLAASLMASKLSERRKPDYLVRELSRIPADIGGFTSTEDPPLSELVLQKLLPTSYISRTYKANDRNVRLFIAYYAQQKAGESMHSPKHCLPGSGWEIWDYGSVEVPTAGRRFTVNKYSIQNGGERMLVLYWYQSKQRIIASEYVGKVMLVKDSLLEGNTAGSIVRLMLPDRPGALAEGVAFASRLIPEVQQCFGTGF